MHTAVCVQSVPVVAQMRCNPSSKRWVFGTVGLQQAGVIMALNRNPRAAILKVADIGIVGDWQTYLPPCVEALRPVLGAML